MSYRPHRKPKEIDRIRAHRLRFKQIGKDKSKEIRPYINLDPLIVRMYELQYKLDTINIGFSAKLGWRRRKKRKQLEDKLEQEHLNESERTGQHIHLPQANRGPAAKVRGFKRTG